MQDKKNVAVIVETSNEYARGIIRGIHEFSRVHADWAISLSEHGRHEIDGSFADHQKFDGVIARIETQLMARIITRMGVPTVDVSATRLIPGIPWVETDDEAITRLAIDHLHDCGLRNLAFFGDPFYNWSRWRQEAFERFLDDSGRKEKHIYNLPSRKEPGVPWWTLRDEIYQWLKDLPKPVGIMACYDACGQQLLEICRYYDLVVPEDIAVVGVDNDELLCELANPTLSSVVPNTKKTGLSAAQLLERMMNGERLPERKYAIEPIGIHRRISTDVLEVAEPLIAQAIAFIRKNAHKNIRVDDVLNVVPLSRRALESRFRQALSRTPHQEIVRVRVNYIRDLLLKTDMSLSEISEIADIAHPEYLTVFFKKETGLTPTDYRRRIGGRSVLKMPE